MMGDTGTEIIMALIGISPIVLLIVVLLGWLR